MCVNAVFVLGFLHVTLHAHAVSRVIPWACHPSQGMTNGIYHYLALVTFPSPVVCSSASLHVSRNRYVCLPLTSIGTCVHGVADFVFVHR